MNLQPLMALAAIALAAACAGSNNQASALVSAQKAAYTTKASYAALLVGADVYAKLPRCTDTTVVAGALPACSDQAVLAQMVKAQTAASAAINAFEAAARSVASTPDILAAAQATATQAIAALTTILDTYHIAHQ